MFSGPLPAWLSQLGNLTFLGLANNSLTGSIPASLSNLQALEVLSLEGNELSGPLPESLTSAPSLSCLSVRNNPGLCGTPGCTLLRLPIVGDCETDTWPEAAPSEVSFGGSSSDLPQSLLQDLQGINLTHACGGPGATGSGVGASLPAIAAGRMTTSGKPCALPFVWNGTVYSDCIEQDGMELCQDASMTWHRCAPKVSASGDGDPSASAALAALAAGTPNATSTSVYTSGPGSYASGSVGTGSGTTTTESQGGSDPASTGSTGQQYPSTYSGLAAASAVSLNDLSYNWTTGETCDNPVDQFGGRFRQWRNQTAGMPEDERDAFLANATQTLLGTVSSECGDNGFCLLAEYPQPMCIALPPGGVFPTNRYGGSRLPPPLAFFPLTGGHLESFPFGHYQGLGTNIKWVKDDKFVSVPECVAGEEPSYIRLQNVTYGASGKFAVSLWFRHKYSSFGGSDFQFLFSDGAQPPGSLFQAFIPNQLHIYLPEGEGAGQRGQGNHWFSSTPPVYTAATGARMIRGPLFFPCS